MDKIFDRLGGAAPAPAETPRPAKTAAPEQAESDNYRHAARNQKGRFAPSGEKPVREKPKSKVKARAKKAESVDRTNEPLPDEVLKVVRGYPHLDARFSTNPDGEVMIDVDFNKMFIGMIDKKYAGDPSWDRTLDGNVKVAMFLYNMLAAIVEPYFVDEDAPPPMGAQESFDEVPTLAVRGGVENVTRVDISKAQRVGVIGG